MPGILGAGHLPSQLRHDYVANSPLFADQTWKYSNKEWGPMHLTESDVLATW